MSVQLAILVSGRGSNLEAILQAVKEGRLDADVKLVLSNAPEAKALLVAERFGVTTAAVSNKNLSRKEHEELVLAELAKYPIDLLVLAGYMRILSKDFLKSFKAKEGFFRIVNIHPSMLPAFPGKSAYEDAFAANVSLSGITIHLVDEEVDHGPILAQESFNRMPDDTLDTFKARGLSIEHALYPRVLAAIAERGLLSVLESPLAPRSVSPETSVKESVER